MEGTGNCEKKEVKLLELIGELPKVDTEVGYNQFQFKIVSVSKRRIEQVLITLLKK